MSNPGSATSKSSEKETAKKREVTPSAKQAAVAPQDAPSLAALQRAVEDPRTSQPAEILALQRRYGNQAVQRLLANHTLQAKLTVGAANDAYEQEADRVAAQVMSAPAPSSAVQRIEEEEEIQAKPIVAAIIPLAQRALEEEELQAKFIQREAMPEEEELQAKSMVAGTFAPGADFESRLAATRGGGSSLPESTRDFMEQRMGADFGGVRLHTGGDSVQLNREISAQAFTRGQDIYLGEGKENVDSHEGRQLLAHELTHVVQQNGGSLEGSSAAGVHGNVSPSIQRVMEDHGKVGMLYLVSVDKGEAAPADTDEWKYTRFAGAEGKWDKKYGDREVYKRDKNVKRTKSPAEIKQEQKGALQDLLGANRLYEKPAEGFELLMQELFKSTDDGQRNQGELIETLYTYQNGTWLPNTANLSDGVKRDSVTKFMKAAYHLYDAAQDVETINAQAKVLEAGAKRANPDAEAPVPQIEAIKGVGVGFHSTSSPMDVVAAPNKAAPAPFRSVSLLAQKEKLGWGGLQKVKDLSFKQKQFALNEPWNPLKAQLDKGAHYRKGDNWDNELLSTVSVAISPGPAIKFPFPAAKSDKATSYLYAVIVEKAYPTFMIQEKGGKSPFGEIAVDKVDPKDIIGVTQVDKDYAPANISVKGLQLGYAAHEDKQTDEIFAYTRKPFAVNPVFEKEWRANKQLIITKAKATLDNKLGIEGIYDNLKITKG